MLHSISVSLKSNSTHKQLSARRSRLVLRNTGRAFITKSFKALKPGPCSSGVYVQACYTKVVEVGGVITPVLPGLS